jgi:hypothetical protein
VLPVILALALVTAAPRPPTVTGPRDTDSQRPTYVFHARGAIGFRCAFDTARLHACKARYSQRLAPGIHTLRVQAIGRDGSRSRTVEVLITVREPVPPLHVANPVKTGNGAGIPGVGFSALWVPNTFDGTVSRFNLASGAVDATYPLGDPTPAARTGYLDSAATGFGSVWAASDFNAVVKRIAPEDGHVEATVQVAPRPLGIAIGGGAVWTAQFLEPTLTRIDPATNMASSVGVAGARLTGLAWLGDQLWALSVGPARALRIDPATGAVLQTVALAAPMAVKRSFVEAWWLTAGAGALWATLPNQDAFARITREGTATFWGVQAGRPFGIAADVQSIWISTDRGVERLATATGSLAGVGVLPPGAQTGFTEVAIANGATWISHYDRGELFRVFP